MRIWQQETAPFRSPRARRQHVLDVDFRPFHGRLRHVAHRHEEPRALLEHLRDELMLPRAVQSGRRRHGASGRDHDVRTGRASRHLHARAAHARGRLVAEPDQYIPSLRTFKAIGIEVGLQDSLIGVNKALSHVLTSYGIEHVYETYEGNHTNKVAERYETRVLPFFSRELAFD